MPKLFFVGLGLGKGMITRQAIETLRAVDKIYMETYTNVSDEISADEISRISGRPVITLKRRDLEEHSGRLIVEDLERGLTVALVVVGDPFIATTHIALRLEVEKRGFKTEVVPGHSIYNVAVSLSGLSVYRFAPPVTIVYTKDGITYETPYVKLEDNLRRGLHTLFLLDLDVEGGRLMEIREAIEVLETIEDRRKANVVTGDLVGLGLARAGTKSFTSKAGTLEELKRYSFGPPPHTLIIPSSLTPLEEEALRLLHGLKAEIRHRLQSRRPSIA